MKLNYPNINEMIRDLNLDPNDWVNKEAFRFLSSKAFDRTAVKVKHCPETLTAGNLTCNCGHTFSPNLLDKRPLCKVLRDRTGHLIRQRACFVPCPSCGACVLVNLPIKPFRNWLKIYSDEAERRVDGKRIFVYSLVSYSGSNEDYESFSMHIQDVKRSMAPSADPNAWQIHLKELMSGDERNGAPHLKHLSLSDVRNGVTNVLEIVRAATLVKKLNIYCAVGISASDNLTQQQELAAKEELFSCLLLQVIEDATRHGFGIEIFCERTGSDGWLTHLFDGGRLTLMWPFLTNGLPVRSPQFVKPTFHSLLGIADFASYIVARYLYCIGKKAKGIPATPDFLPDQLGEVVYLLAASNGDVIKEMAPRFPLKQMLRGTSWDLF